MFEGDEWKVMGLAAYGKPEYYDFFCQASAFSQRQSRFQTRHPRVRPPSREVLPVQRGTDERARSVASQRRRAHRETLERRGERTKVLEDTAAHLALRLYEQTGSRTLHGRRRRVHSVMNGRIMTETPFKFFIQPAGDAGWPARRGAARLAQSFKTAAKVPHGARLLRSGFQFGRTQPLCATRD